MVQKTLTKSKSIKFSASIGGIKTLANDTINLTLTVGSNQLMKIVSLLDVKQAGDSLAITAVRVTTPKNKIKANAPKKQDGKKTKAIRRVRRYPYKE